MPEGKLKQDLDGDDGQQTLRKAIILFAIVEALVLIPIIVYTIFR
jgi:hypothetical protein